MGILNAQELYRFGVHTDFDGSEEDWEKEYLALFEETGAQKFGGITMELFGVLVDDESGSGCYCTDDELHEILEKLEEEFPGEKVEDDSKAKEEAKKKAEEEAAASEAAKKKAEADATAAAAVAAA